MPCPSVRVRSALAYARCHRGARKTAGVDIVERRPEIPALRLHEVPDDDGGRARDASAAMDQSAARARGASVGEGACNRGRLGEA